MDAINFTREPARGRGGLFNENGKTCFLNVCIQSIRCIPELCSVICQQPTEATEARTEFTLARKQGLIRHLQDIIKALLNLSPIPTRTKPMLGYLQFLMQCDLKEQQQDCHECMSKLLEAAYDVLPASGAQDLKRLLAGTSEVCLLCTVCNTKTSSFADEWVTAMAIHETDTSLEEILDRCATPEILDDGDKRFCETCQEKTRTIKIEGVWKRPPILLTIMLKRFSFQRGLIKKITNAISFPEEIDLNEFMSPNFKDVVPNYSLAGVTVHEGPSIVEGHYYHYGKFTSGWYKFNDSSVTEVPWEEVKESFGGDYQNKTAYCLYYKREQHSTIDSENARVTAKTCNPSTNPPDSTHKAKPAAKPSDMSKRLPQNQQATFRDSENARVKTCNPSTKPSGSTTTPKPAAKPSHHVTPSASKSATNISRSRSNHKRGTKTKAREKIKKMSKADKKDQTLQAISSELKAIDVSSENESIDFESCSSHSDGGMDSGLLDEVTSVSQTSASENEKSSGKARKQKKKRKKKYQKRSTHATEEKKLGSENKNSDCRSSSNHSKDNVDISLLIDEEINVCEQSIIIEEESEEESENERSKKKGRKQKKKNKNSNIATAKMKYDKVEGSFSVKAESWGQVWDFRRGTFKNRKLWKVILRRHMKAFRPFCKHNFKGSGEAYKTCTGDVSLRAYLYCGTGNCKHYSLKWLVTPNQSDNLIISVKSAGKENHEEALTNTTQVRGGERDILQKRLENDTAYSVKKKDVENLDPIVYADNNLQDVKGDNVYWHANSEALSLKDLHKDSFFDVAMKRRREIESDKSVRYIQMVAEPLIIHLFSEVQIRAILDHFPNKRFKITVYADATGTLIRSNVYYGSTIYLYVFVVNINGVIIPLCEMISALHDQDAIGSILGKFRMFVINDLKRKWPCVGRIVTDCSFAFIHAIMRQWNDTTLERYLNSCYNYVRGKYTSVNFSGVVIARLCKNHWTAMVCNNLSGHIYKGGIKSVIVECILKMMECRTIQSFDDIFLSLAVILICPVKHEIVDEAFMRLALSAKEIKGKAFEVPKGSSISEELDENRLECSDTYDHTPFHRHCVRLLASAEQYVADTVGETSLKLDNTGDLGEKTGDDNDNEFCCPKFYETIFFKNKYSVLVPLWTNVMDDLREDVDSKTTWTATNAHAETYMKDKKKFVHKGSLYDKPGRFILKDKRDVLLRTKQVLLGFQTGRTASQTKHEEEDSSESDREKVEREVNKVSKNPPSSRRKKTEKIGDDQVEEEYFRKGSNGSAVTPKKKVINLNSSATETWQTPPPPKFNYSQGATIKRIAYGIVNPTEKPKSPENIVIATATCGQTNKLGEDEFGSGVLEGISPIRGKRSVQEEEIPLQPQSKKMKHVNFKEIGNSDIMPSCPIFDCSHNPVSTQHFIRTSTPEHGQPIRFGSNFRNDLSDISVARRSLFQDTLNSNNTGCLSDLARPKSKKPSPSITKSMSAESKTTSKSSWKTRSLSLKGVKETWQRTDKSATPSFSTQIGRRLSSILGHQKAPRSSSKSGADTKSDLDNHDVAKPSVDNHENDCEYQEIVETVEDRLQRSHFLPFREDLQFGAAPLIGLLNSSEVSFINKQTTGDHSALLFVYGNDDNPIYLKEFMPLLKTDSDLPAPILDACLFLISEHYINATILLTTTVQGREIILPRVQKKIEIDNYRTVLIPLKRGNEWVLVHADTSDRTLYTYDVCVSTEGKTLEKYFNQFHGSDWQYAGLLSCPSSNIEAYSEEPSGIRLLNYVLFILTQNSFSPKSLRQTFAKLCLTKGREKKDLENLQTPLGSLFPNGLLQNCNYYLSRRSTHYVVASYGNGMDILDSLQYALLAQEDAQLITVIIDAAIYSIAKSSKDFMYVRIPTSNEVLFRRFQRSCIINHVPMANRIVLMPYNEKGYHWKLAIANFKTLTFTDLDPYHPQVQSPRTFNNFIAFLKKRNSIGFEKVNTDAWTIEPPFPYCPNQKLSDTVNCGLYVIYYAYVKLGFQCASLEFNPGELRKQLQSILLQYAADMTSLCAKCGKDQYAIHRRNFGEMIFCSMCHRWLHVKCSSKLKNLCSEEYRSENYLFICDICSEYVDQQNSDK